MALNFESPLIIPLLSPSSNTSAFDLPFSAYHPYITIFYFPFLRWVILHCLSLTLCQVSVVILIVDCSLNTQERTFLDMQIHTIFIFLVSELPHSKWIFQSPFTCIFILFFNSWEILYVFIHFFINEHLGCFQFQEITN